MPECIERAQEENVIKTFGGKRVMILLEAIREEHTANVIEIPATGIGDLSDGYHTFNGLYYQRMILFAALVKQNRDRAWKSYRHEDGEPCFGGGWFIVGIDTPEGSYTYHCENKDFDLFECVELPVAKHWDGHTEEDVTRLLALPAAGVREVVTCEECVWHVDVGYHYCNKWCAPCPNDCEFFCAYGEHPTAARKEET